MKIQKIYLLTSVAILIFSFSFIFVNKNISAQNLDTIQIPRNTITIPSGSTTPPELIPHNTIKPPTLASKATFSFGGKVLSIRVPNVTCSTSGTGPIMLTSNTQGAIDAVSSQFSSSTGEKIVGGTTGIYRMIPFFATDQSKVPKVGGFILGKADIAPNFSICKMQIGDTQIPFPVRKTTIYNVSKNMGLK